ncbi:MAG TPA: ATP-binding protein [Solirubrobacteraceae bacterium]|jgi:anti-sigma regulatory factor (Ser/Thr protein kinase)|nr:ATP-binding protein [Solirubrobacteraceae bacterium]
MGLDANAISVREELPAAPPSVAAARRLVRRFTDELDVDVDAVELAVSEAVSNAVVHAYESGDGAVEVQAVAAPYELRVVIRDSGRGLAAGGAEGGAGFGLKIIRRLARHVELADTPRGVTLTMTFPLGGRWATG